MKKALEALSEQVVICEERCKEPVNPSKRRHEDPDSGPHEGEKRRRLIDIPQGGSIRTMSLFDREEGSSRGGGEEISQQEMEQMIQEQNARRELASFGPGLLINLSEGLNAPETLVHKIDQTLTLRP